MSSVCQILESNYPDIGFGDPELVLDADFFLEITTEFPDIDFVQDNLEGECSQETLYANTGYADVENISIDNNLAYTNVSNYGFSSTQLDFNEINKFSNRFIRSTIYHADRVEIKDIVTFLDVTFPTGFFNSIPVINCTVIGENVKIYISDITKESFRINKPLGVSIKVNYFASQDNFLFT